MVPETEPLTPAIRVLVVEDEVLIRAFVADELRQAGFAVIEAGRAEEALSFLKGGEPVDVVFTDVQMPGRLNGLQLAHELQTRYPFMPVIVTSGNLASENAAELRLFIRKPYNIAQVVALVFKSVGRVPPSSLE